MLVQAIRAAVTREQRAAAHSKLAAAVYRMANQTAADPDQWWRLAELALKAGMSEERAVRFLSTDAPVLLLPIDPGLDDDQYAKAAIRTALVRDAIMSV